MNKFKICLDKIELREIEYSDVHFFDETEYSGLSKEKRIELINNSIKGLFNGRFFKFYLIKIGEFSCGCLNFYAHHDNQISVAPYIKTNFRKLGIGITALKISYRLAKEKGFKIVIADIDKTNRASISLHKKLGFTIINDYINKNNREMIRLQKNI